MKRFFLPQNRQLFGLTKNIILITFSFFLASCYNTKHIHNNNYILKKNSIIINDKKDIKIKNISKKEINTIIKQKPNKKILGILPFHLSIYNLSNPKKSNWANNYLRKIGESPIILDTTLIKKSVNQIKSHFENNGYFTALVESKILYKKNTAHVSYHIKTGNSYLIGNINYNNIKQPEIRKIIKSNNKKNDIKKGDVFTYSALNARRVDIENLLQNNGYYNFSKELIYVNADSTKEKNVNLNFLLEEENTDSMKYRKFNIRDIYIHTKTKLNQPDTISYNGYYFIVEKFQDYNLELKQICALITINQNNLYSRKNAKDTYRNLSNLLLFNKILIEFTETNKTGYLDCYIYLEQSTKMYYSIEAEAKRSADEGNLGVSGYLQFGNNNLFNGGENLNGKVKLSLENRQHSTQDDESLFNTREISYELRLRIPRLIIPKKLNAQLKNSFQKNTNLAISLSNRKRPDFSSQVVTQKLGYSWRNSNEIQHQLNLIELSFSDIGELNSFIQNELTQNPYLSEQFEDKMIPSTNYIFTFNNQKIYKIQNYTYFKTKIDISGNILSMLSPIIKLNNNKEGNYLLFGNPFSQYIRLDFDIRRFLMFSESNILVLRGFYGLGYSYQNSEELPIQKQFFSGGVNSIRAWEAFGLGPGSIETLNNYSTGDIKLEFNIEYRFSLLNSLKAALFIDGGNIWSIKNDLREGSIFKLDNFFNQIALGIGYGVRYDFDFFVIRLDVATPIRNPSLPKNERWVKNPFNQNFRYNLAIGYPF